ncbi:MAG: outer membrane beta-barrel protein [Bacteroidales bacterium]|nr:outer membrane beta-barrel protein [Bacteroidales bacterium]
MKKLIALCVVAVLSVAAATTADAGRFGIKGGINVTSLDVENMESIGALGYSAGITWQWNLPLWFAIQPDLMYHVKATNLDAIGSQLSLGTVELTPNIQWGPRFANKNVRIFAQASPFIGYAVSKDVTAGTAGTISPEIQEILDQYGVKGDWTAANRFTYGCGAGVGIQLWALQVTAQYVWNFGSLTNLSGASWDDFNDSNFGGYNVTVALMFGGKKKNK